MLHIQHKVFILREKTTVDLKNFNLIYYDLYEIINKLNYIE